MLSIDWGSWGGVGRQSLEEAHVCCGGRHLLALNPRLSEHKADCPTVLSRAWPSSILFTGWRARLERSGPVERSQSVGQSHSQSHRSCFSGCRAQGTPGIH